mmetsp:Transcript_126451/g.219239  ORF Transcript_126451/g.219239 Transcript_126451/m.219239 type:complete len:95 (+) Transcript_126451:722-1006(+)
MSEWSRAHAKSGDLSRGFWLTRQGTGGGVIPGAVKGDSDSNEFQCASPSVFIKEFTFNTEQQVRQRGAEDSGSGANPQRVVGALPVGLICHVAE